MGRGDYSVRASQKERQRKLKARKRRQAAAKKADRKAAR
jgi:hypothetical protein